MSSEMPIAVDNGRVKPGVLEGSNRGSWRGQTGVLGRLKLGFLWKAQAGVLMEGPSRGSCGRIKPGFSEWSNAWGKCSPGIRYGPLEVSEGCCNKLLGEFNRKVLRKSIFKSHEGWAIELV